MTAATYNITIEQGATWNLSVIYRAPNNTDGTPGAPIDVTGCVATMQIRTAAGAPDPAIITLTETSGITVGTTDGSFALMIDESDTLAFSTWTRAKYDFYITFPAGATRRLLVGTVTVIPTITDPTNV